MLRSFRIVNRKFQIHYLVSKHLLAASSSSGPEVLKENQSGDKKQFNLRLYAQCVFFGALLFKSSKEDNNEKLVEEGNRDDFVAGEKRPDLPTFSAEEVSKHDSKDSFWVIYKNGVYDVTAFLPEHPGGNQILNAGGSSIEPFWNVYGMHKTKEVYTLLENYRIGNLNEDDIVDHSGDELWVKEPIRDRRLIVKTLKPFNAEVPPKFQIDSLDTPKT